MAKSKKLRVKRWIATGELQVTGRETQDEILEHCGRLLDKSCSYEILGEVLFQATDGKYYTVTVEAVVGRANPEWVKEVIEEHKDDGKPRGKEDPNPSTTPGDAAARDNHPLPE